LSPLWNFLPPLLALAVVAAITQFAVVLAGAFRSRDYRRFEDRSASEIEREFSLPDFASPLAEEHRRHFQPLLRELQRTANRAQTAYHDTVVRSAACLAIGFAATAGGLLGTVSWQGLFRFQAWQSFLNWGDMFALLSVLGLFLYATSLYRPWLIKRAETELVRQYQFLNVIFPDAFPLAAKPADYSGRLAQREAKDRHLGRLVGRIETSWQERKTLIERLAGEYPQLDLGAVILYLRKRVLRQLGWFTDSIARLEHIAGRRKAVLLVLYFATAALAIAQLIWFENGSSLPFVRPILLFITGLSLAMTAYYTNQNLGSIVHRYNLQQREIRRWLGGLVDDLNNVETPDPPGEKVALISTHVTRFEELMIYELVDWINISGHDVIELG
jgi:hypothetical protein